MLKGFHLTLLMGPVVPIPAPQTVVDALDSVQITTGGARSGFQLSFAAGTNSPLTRTLVPAGYFDPGIRIIVVVTVGGMPNVLMDGIITRQEVAPGNDPGQSKITITGEDLSVLMDLIEMPFMRYPAMNEYARVNLILAKYAVFGIVPVVIPPIIIDIPIPIEQIPTQTGTDLSYIQMLANRVGYVFYVETGPAPGSNIAYWGPDLRIPNPQPALNVNMDAHTNVESLSFGLDGLKKKVVVMTIMDPVTKKIPIPIPIPNLSVLRPPQGARFLFPLLTKIEFPQDLAKLNPLQAAARALGISFSAADAITASGQLNVLRYGRVLKARHMVGVRGAGLAYDGFYYVNNVSHNIKRGEYKQSFNLSRDGLVSITPKVVP